MSDGRLSLLGYDERVAEILLNMLLAWRSMHSQARGLNSVMIRHLGQDIDTYTLREAEFSCNAIVGFNFGDGHLHDQSRSRGCRTARLPSRSTGGSMDTSASATREPYLACQGQDPKWRRLSIRR
jgi:hypothetical protein